VRLGRAPAIAALLLLPISACSGAATGGRSTISGSSGGGATGGSNDPASLLATRDGSSDISRYTQALDRWQAKCTDTRVADAGYVDFAYDDLQKNGVGESSRLAVMRHLTASVPNSIAPTDCRSVTAAYLVLREK
jgi:urocanate hydratase